MIVVDSSVWIDYFNGIINEHTDFLDLNLTAEIIAVGDLILTEVLQGFRSDEDYHHAFECMNSLFLIEMGGKDHCLKAADNYRSLRKKGVTIRKTIDCLIATACIEKKIPLLFSDRDFDPFIEIGLKRAYQPRLR